MGNRRRDTDASVSTWTARRLGVQTQAELEAERRAGDRIGAYGEDPRQTASPTDNFDDWTNTGNAYFNLDEDGNFVRFGPTLDKTDPLATVNGNTFVLVRDASGNMFLQGEGGSSSFAWFELTDTGQYVARQGSITLEDILGASRITLIGNTGIVTADSFVSTGQQLSAPGQWLAGYHSDPGANTLSTYGMTAPTITAASLTNFTVNDGPGLTLTTSSVSGNAAFVATAANWQTRWGIDAVFKVRTGNDLTNVRDWIGLFVSSPATSSTTVIEHVGIRFDDSIDSVWKLSTGDGAARTTANTSITPAINTTYTMRIVSTNGTDFDFYIDGDLEGTISATLPTNTTLLASYVSVTTRAAETNALRVHHFKMLSH